MTTTAGPNAAEAEVTPIRRAAEQRAAIAWTGSPDNPSAASAVDAMICDISAAGVFDAQGRISHNPPVVDWSPTRPT
jgi:hypothetical protein